VSDNKVFLAQGDKAVAATVVSGRSFGDYIEVISGLNAGDEVIVSGQINLFDQTPITIIK
jgi:multidrug efflux pump subunit AcrA (membrane-fusion protein)